MNGKMDMTEVEGLADLLNADTEAQRMLVRRVVVAVAIIAACVVTAP
jgi:tRNA U34 5-carboxymethylaminomethyl modifying GTPase MnmE/TrmE